MTSIFVETNVYCVSVRCIRCYFHLVLFHISLIKMQTGEEGI